MSLEAQNDKTEFTPRMVHAVFCALLSLVGGAIAVPGASLRDFPENAKWEAMYDESADMWVIRLKAKRKRGIIRPRRKLILPP